MDFKKSVVGLRDKFATILFSIGLSAVIILGKHIHLTDQVYQGTGNTIDSYHRYDLAEGLLFACCIYIGILLCERMIKKRPIEIKGVSGERIPLGKITVSSIVLMLLWSPYLYAYYPGFIFGDSTANIAQALGQQPLTNHHPVAYVLFIRLCLRLGQHLGGLTIGLAIYSVIQMGIMALGIGLMVQWIRTRFRLNRWLTWLMLVVFGCSPYIAQYSIAIWKDPIFSVTIVCVTILLFDILYVETDKKQNIIRNILLLISVLAMIFSRNNGFYIAIAIVCLSVFLLFRKMTRQKGIQILVICLIVMIASKFITGPVYDAYGIVKDDEKAESYGIFLAQMARVVVENGELSAEDSDYMGRLLPMEEYQSAYTPCLVDNLKWNPNFQKEVLEDGFFRTYLSILRKNPRICFEAWELQTFGFWSVNQKWVNGFTGNILNGVPRNIYPEYGMGVEGIETKLVDNNSFLTKMFPYTARCIPIGYIHWLLIGVALFALLRLDFRRLTVLAPALGLMATLILASPISYWPRYGLAQQLLLPLFIVMIFLREGEHQNGQNCSFNTLLQ